MVRLIEEIREVKEAIVNWFDAEDPIDDEDDYLYNTPTDDDEDFWQ